MSNETRTVTLPEAETIMSHLKSIDDNCHFVQHFYPLITKKSGVEYEPIGIVMMIQMAIYNYGNVTSAVIVATLNMKMDQYIDALVTDKIVANEAKAHWAKIQEMM